MPGGEPSFMGENRQMREIFPRSRGAGAGRQRARAFARVKSSMTAGMLVAATSARRNPNMRPTKRIIAGAAFVCLAAVTGSYPSGQTAAQPQKVDIPTTSATLEGIPTVRVDSTEGETTRRVLNAAEAAKERLAVTVKDGTFYWTSRGNRPLRLSSSGEFTYLASEPGQYIRLTRLNDRIAYVEHVDADFGSVTWWGELRIRVDR
jgi:hypothetical protein